MTTLDPSKDAELFVPGEFRCAKCGFTLSQFTLHAHSGAVGERDRPGEKCPNDGSPLWRVTWKQRAHEHYERAAEEMARADKAEAAVGVPFAWWAHGLMEKMPDNNSDIFTSREAAQEYADAQHDFRIRVITPLYTAPSKRVERLEADLKDINRVLSETRTSPAHLVGSEIEWCIDHCRQALGDRS